MDRKYVGHLIVKQKIRVVFDFDGGNYRELERAALVAAMDNGMVDEEHDGVWVEFVEPIEREIDREANRADDALDGLSNMLKRAREDAQESLDRLDEFVAGMDDHERSEHEFEGGGPE